MHGDTQPTNYERQGEDATEPNTTTLGERIKRSPVSESSIPQQRPAVDAVSEVLDGSDMDIDIPSAPIQTPQPMGEVAGTVTHFSRLHHDGDPKDNEDDRNGESESRSLLYFDFLHHTLVALHSPLLAIGKEIPSRPHTFFMLLYLISLQECTSNLNTDVILCQADQHTGITAQALRTSFDPRKVDRKDSMSYSTTASGSATPRSSVIDTSISNAGNMRSGEQTPIGPTPASFAIPHLPPSAGVAGRGKESPSEDLKLVMKHLSHFAHCIRQDASLMMQQDAAFHKLERKKREKEKWRPHHDSFTSLAEEQDKDMERLKTATEQITEKRKKYEENRDKSMQILARTLLSISSGAAIPQPENESKTKQLETEMKDLKAELCTVRFAMNNPKADEGRLQDLKASQSRLSIELGDLALRSVSRDDHAKLEVKIADLTRETSKIQSLSSQNEMLNDQITLIHEHIRSFDTLKTDVLKNKENSGYINGEFQALSEHVKRENQESKGLVVQQDKVLDKYQEAITSLGRELKNAINDTASLITRMNTLESLPEHDPRPSAQEISSDLMRAVESTSQNVTAIAGELLLLKQDQETKDDLVGQEVERLDAALTSIDGRIESAKKDFDNLSRQVDSNATKIQDVLSRPINMTTPILQPSNNIVHAPPQVIYGSPHGRSNILPTYNGIHEQTPPQLRDRFSQLLDDLADRIYSCETFILTFKQKYENLTSDELSCSVARQMQQMYPFASTAQAEIQTLKEKITVLSNITNQLGVHVAANTGHVNTMIKSLDNHSKELTLIRERQENEVAELGSVRDRLGSFSNEFSHKVIVLDESFAALTRSSEDSTEAYRILTTSFETAKAELDETVRLLRSDINAISTSFDEIEKTALKDLSSLNAKVIVLDEDIRTRNWMKQEGDSSGDAALRDVSTGVVSMSDSSDGDIPLKIARVNSRRSNATAASNKHKDIGKRSRGSGEESGFDERKKKKS